MRMFYKINIQIHRPTEMKVLKFGLKYFHEKKNCLVQQREYRHESKINKKIKEWSKLVWRDVLSFSTRKKKGGEYENLRGKKENMVLSLLRLSARQPLGSLEQYFFIYLIC